MFIKVTLLACVLVAVAPLEAAEKSDRREGFSRDVRAYAEMLNLPGLAVAVARNGEILYRETVGFADLEQRTPVRPDSIFWLASVTKTFSAVLLAQYEQERRISLADPVIKYPFASVGFFPQRVDERVQLRHVLSHTSEWIPGEEFVYHGGRYNFIYGVFQSISGLPFPDAYHKELETRIFKPLKLESTLAGYPGTNETKLRSRIVTPYRFNGELGTFEVNRSALNAGAAYPGAGLLSTVEDLAAYSAALDNDRLVTKETYDRITTPFTSNRGQKMRMGLGWFTESFAGTALHWAYGLGDSDSAILLRVPSQKLTLIVLCNSSHLTAHARLGGGNALHSPIVSSFLRHFVAPDEDRAEVDYFRPVEEIRAQLRKQTNSFSKAITPHELMGHALLRTFVEKNYKGKAEGAEDMTQLLCELYPTIVTEFDPTFFHLLSQQPGASLDGAARTAIEAYEKSGRFHPWVLGAIAERYKAKGDVEQAMRYSQKLADGPGFEEQGEKQSASLFLAKQYGLQRNFEKARHYAWQALIWARQSGGNDRLAAEQLQEINGRER